MAGELAKYLAAQARIAPGRQPRDPLPREERIALHKLRREAHAAGSELKSGGLGGLPSSLVLHVFRRDGYTCKVCGELGDKSENGGLTIHHVGGIMESEWLDKKGHKNVPNNLVAICDRCHNRIHQEAKSEGLDSSQVEPLGDMTPGEQSHAAKQGLPWR